MSFSSALSSIASFHRTALGSFDSKDVGQTRAGRFFSGAGEVAAAVVSAIPVVGFAVSASAAIDYQIAQGAGEKPSLAGARIAVSAFDQAVAVGVFIAAGAPVLALVAGAAFALPGIIKGGYKMATFMNN
jgi:hypothetical protein